MFLHIGGDVVVFKKDIIAIIDSETGLAGAATKEFLETDQAADLFRNVKSDEKVKAYVVTDREIYLSPISAFTLLKRS
jgi:uncharacterized iron-regulated membrane protein